jgi:hypothetical protein
LVSRRASDQWIRDALKANKDDVQQIRDDMSLIHSELKEFMDCVLGSIPDKNPKAHLSAHERIELQDAAQRKRAEDDAKLRLEVRNGIIKTVVNVLMVAAGGILLLGVQTQFGIWVNGVREPIKTAAPEAPKIGAAK